MSRLYEFKQGASEEEILKVFWSISRRIHAPYDMNAKFAHAPVGDVIDLLSEIRAYTNNPKIADRASKLISHLIKTNE